MRLTSLADMTWSATAPWFALAHRASQRLGDAGVDGENLIEAGDRQDFCDDRLGRGQGERPAAAVQPSVDLNEHAEPRRVHEPEAIHVHDQVRCPLGGRHEHIVQLLAGTQVAVATEGHDRARSLDRDTRREPHVLVLSPFVHGPLRKRSELAEAHTRRLSGYLGRYTETAKDAVTLTGSGSAAAHLLISSSRTW
jgi:hypothetical protein